MIYSMTGYGRGSASDKTISVEVEVKSINSRFLDLSLKFPSSIANKEYEIREIIRTKIKRGKVNTAIQLKINGGEESIPAVSREKLKAYIALLKEIKKTARLTDKIKLDHLVVSREIFTSNEPDIDESLMTLLKKALDDALEDLLRMKRNEGEELRKDLLKRIDTIEQKVDIIEKESRNSVNEYFKILKERVKVLIEDITSYTERLELELALIAEKSEITEECVRLKSHIKFFLESLQGQEDPGRKLNFLCQEMNREVNTISSKSISTVITHNAVLIKEEIERIREQIQNIE